MIRFKNPHCQAPDIDSRIVIVGGRDDRKCHTEMKLVAERHPFYRPGMWIFICPKCEAVQAFDEATAMRTLERA